MLSQVERDTIIEALRQLAEMRHHNRQRIESLLREQMELEVQALKMKEQNDRLASLLRKPDLTAEVSR